MTVDTSSGSGRILIIEENLDLLEALQEMLEALGFAVESHTGELQAIASCGDSKGGFDLLVTDAASSTDGGVELVDRVRRHCGPLPALMLAGVGISEMLRPRVEAGEVEVLRVPFSAHELREAVTGAIARRETVTLAMSLRADDASRARAERPPAAGGRLRWALPVAAALALAAGFVMTRLGAGPPPLPAAPERQEVRGAVLEALAPRGDLDRAPERFAWLGHRDADEYVLSVRRADLSLVWRHASEFAFATPPAEITEAFEPGVTYDWEVEARDSSRHPIGRSARIEFRIRATQPEADAEMEGST